MPLTRLADLPGLLPAAPRVVASGNFATPWRLLADVDAVLPAYRLWVLNAQPGLPDREGVTWETCFVGPGMRHHPRLSYVPSRLSLVPTLLGGPLAPDLVLLRTTPPRDGRVSLGIEVNVLPAAIEAARARGGLVVAQVDPGMPWTFGDAELDVAALDLLVEADDPLVGPGLAAPDEEAQVIAERVAARVPDGATLQAGIGAVPDAVLRGLTGRRSLRVWSEMFSDGVLLLEQQGALDPGVPVQASFLFGGPELMAWVDRNPRVRMRRTEVANDPARIARNPAMVSLNTALQVDLFGQANASRVRRRIHSGFGGQTDFIVGALHSPGGQALLALHSWHPKADVSTIVPLVDEPVTSFQVSAVVTEQGSAEVLGRDQQAQAAALVEHAAHPRAREALREAAVGLGLGAVG